MQLSNWGKQMSRRSGIRAIMEDIATVDGAKEGDWLNLSPGNPSLIPEAVSTWRRLAQEALAESFVGSSCRYGPSRGSSSLVAAIAAYFNAVYGWSIGPENVVVGPGSQMLCFMATTAFAGPMDDSADRPLVLPRLPDYPGYQGLSPEPSGVRGVPPVIVTEDSRRFRYAVDLTALSRQVDMGMMLLSNPANPTGGTVTPDELASMISLAQERDVPLVIDHAYGTPFPRVTGTAVDPVLHPRVLNTFTVSKAGLPGERLGFAVGPADMIEELVRFTANATLHAPQLIQSVVERALVTREIDVLARSVIAPYYRAKRQLAEDQLHSTLPDHVGWRLHSSDGGMFCWLWFDDDRFDDLAVYQALKRRRMVVVPGRHFFVAPFTDPVLAAHATRCVRLSLSPDEWVIGEGIARLSEAIEELARAGTAR